MTAPDAAGHVHALDTVTVERAVATLAARLAGHRVLALRATPTIETILGALAAWRAGLPLVPLNPDSGPDEVAHVLRVSAPDACLVPAAREAPPLGGLPAVPVGLDLADDDGLRGPAGTPDVPEETPALIIFTSGTTGAPKGAVLSRRAVRANLAGLADAWRWTSADTLVQALPLFHVHGLVLGVLGPALTGGALVHVGRFDTSLLTAALAREGTMLFGVPTMYRRLADAASGDPTCVEALRRQRLLMSGSAALAPADAARLTALTGRRVLERYGLTETLIVCAAQVGGPAAGVGPPVPGVEVRLVDETGRPMDMPEVLGEIEVRGDSLFSGYLGAEAATRAAFREGWFHTGDTGLRQVDGTYRVAGRSSLDIIKTGGFKVGAGEVEAVLADHPDVAEVAVTGEADADLGQRIVAWVVPAPHAAPDPAALIAHVASRLAPHKRPRLVHFVDALPRTPLGKVEKRRLAAGRP